MKFLIILSFLIVVNISAQEKSILISRNNTTRQIKIKEGKRIRLKTLNGKRLSGRFKVVNDSIIMIKGQQLKFSEIERIKRNPLAMTLPLSIITGTYGGLLILTSTALVIAEPEFAAILVLAIPSGSGLLYTAIKPPNVLKGYTIYRGWKYAITEE